MTYTYRGFSIEKIGVVGSGQIGPDIALHFAKVLHPFGVPVVVVDVSADALSRGRAKLTRKVEKGVQAGAFTPEAGQAMVGGVTFTDDYGQLAGASLIVEAATEDRALKGRIFAQLAESCPGAILASNSSHLAPDAIFEALPDRSRTLVVHYFFPAERNPLVEIVPGGETDPALVEGLMGFYEAIGKVPIRVGARYGYAVNPIFEGLFQAAALAVEEGLGTTREVDAAAARALGLRVGPFTAMNLTGGNPITHHALDVAHDELGPWFRSPRLMKEAMETGAAWDVPGRGETVTLPPEREQAIADTMRGAYLGLAGQILDSGITNVADLDLGLEVGLDMTPAFRMMNELGTGRALALVEAYAAAHEGFAVPRSLRERAEAGAGWDIDYVLRRDVGDVAVLTIRRPRVLNALNDDVFRQLARHFAALREDPAVRAVVLTGFGRKAFVSGADVDFIARMDTPEAGRKSALASQSVCDGIEGLGKPVIAALNGLAFGGGNELAMACSARICSEGLKVAVAQPEVRLGIIPGAGGTQRLPRLVGVEAAARMLRTGRPISGREAVAMGLVREEVPAERLIPAAIELARAAADGLEVSPRLDPAPLETPDALPPLELGHLSRAIDAILTRAILEGCRRPLAEGLVFEAEMFAECCRTADMAIGVRNFLEKGPRANAPFVHA